MQRLFGTADSALSEKLRASLEQSVAWLDDHLDQALAHVPMPRDLRLLEVALFCFATHLPFRGELSLEPYPRLQRFCDVYGERATARATPYRK